MRKLIHYSPSLHGSNEYCSRMGEIISRFADVKNIETRKELALSLCRDGFFKKDTVVINWLENALISRNGRVTIRSLLRTLVIFGLVRLNFRQMIFVRHNYAPHACAPESKWLAEGLVNFLEGLCDKSIVHAPGTRGRSRTYVPHPLYKMENKSVLKSGNHYVIFGRLLRYKRIELLIEKISPEVEVHIIGDAPDKGYLHELQVLVSDRKNLHLKPGLMSGAEAELCIKQSRGVIINHVDENFIVSGSVIYSLSAHRKVFVIDTHVTRWLAEIAPSLIELAPNIDKLCESLLKSLKTIDSESDIRRIEVEFSDEVISSILQALIG